MGQPVGHRAARRWDYYGTRAFSEADFSDDLKRVDIPVLMRHAADAQLVPFHMSAAKAIKLLQHSQLISCSGFPRGLPATEAATILAAYYVAATAILSSLQANFFPCLAYCEQTPTTSLHAA